MGGKSAQEILFRITSILGITFLSKQNSYWNSYYLLAVNKIIFLAAGYKLEAIFTCWTGWEYDLFPYCTQNWCCKPEQSHRAIIPNKCNCINLKCIRDPHLKMKILCHCAVKETPQASQLKRWATMFSFFPDTVSKTVSTQAYLPSAFWEHKLYWLYKEASAPHSSSVLSLSLAPRGKDIRNPEKWQSHSENST